MQSKFIFILFAFTNVFAQNDDNSYTAIAARIAPIGLVSIQGQTTNATTNIVDAAQPERGGNEIYSNYCYVCHASGTAGAPKFGNSIDWAPRIAKGHQILLKHALEGFNFMPAKGSCTDCSNHEIEDAMQYMIDHSSKGNGA